METDSTTITISTVHIYGLTVEGEFQNSAFASFPTLASYAIIPTIQQATMATVLRSRGSTEIRISPL